MKAFLDGLEVDPRLLCVNADLNYGRFGADESDILLYEIRLTHLELANAIRSEFDELVAEMKSDDRKDDVPSELASMNYPTLAVALECFPEQLAEVISTFLDRTVLDAFVQLSARSQVVINSTDIVVVGSDYVSLSGRCYRLSSSAPSCA